MSNLYVIKGMGRGFDGLVVECESGIGFDKDDVRRRLYPISRIINNDAIFGDRNVSFPVPPNGLYIDSENLTPFDEKPREFDSKNPNGAYLSETHQRRHNLEAVLVEYERCLTVSVLEHELKDEKYGNLKPASERDVHHVRYTQNFFRQLDVVRDTVNDEVKKGDLDDLIFALIELKEEEVQTNGQEG